MKKRILLLLLVLVMLLGLLQSCSSIFGGGVSNIVASSYLSEDADGSLHLGGICLVAGLGGKQMRSGTYDYYMSEPVVKDDAKGVGPFLLAYTEMRRAGLIEA